MDEHVVTKEDTRAMSRISVGNLMENPTVRKDERITLRGALRTVGGTR
jgi:hypothetical protein